MGGQGQLNLVSGFWLPYSSWLILSPLLWNLSLRTQGREGSRGPPTGRKVSQPSKPPSLQWMISPSPNPQILGLFQLYFSVGNPKDKGCSHSQTEQLLRQYPQHLGAQVPTVCVDGNTPFKKFSSGPSNMQF